MILFTLGSVFAVRQGFRKITHREPLTAPVLALTILVVSAVFEGFSLRTARTHSPQLRGTRSWWEFIRNSRTPELPVVLLADTGAPIGLGLAFISVALTTVTGDALWDGLATVGIGILLGGGRPMAISIMSWACGRGTLLPTNCWWSPKSSSTPR